MLTCSDLVRTTIATNIDADYQITNTKSLNSKYHIIFSNSYPETMSLLHLQLPISQFKSLNLSTPFLHGTTTISTKSSATTAPNHHNTQVAPIRAMRSLQGRVICTANDKTVNVEVVRLAPHPKYKRRVRKKKKFQAHDPENQFQIGDFVELEKCKPISKKKTFLAIPVPKRTASKQKKEAESPELGIPLESDSSSSQV